MRIYFVFVRYCGASVLAAVIDTLVFLSVHAATGNIALSQVAGRCVAIASLFLVLKKKVFRSEASTAKSLAKYLALATMMGFISYSLIRFLNQRAGLPVLPAKLLAEGLLFLGNFVVQRELIFGRPRTATPANQD
jgi:putative flippase GtrA